MGGWLGPLVVLVAVLVGGLCLRGVDRLEARRDLPASRRRRASGGSRPRLRSLTSTEWIAHGMAARWDDDTVARVKDALR